MRGGVSPACTRELTACVFSRSRSGDTPVEVLGDTRGRLVTDAYSGYSRVTPPSGREHSGCLAHLRRRLFDAQSAAPSAAKTADADLLGTREHLEIRQPRRPMGDAIGYALSNWDALTLFLADPHLPISTTDGKRERESPSTLLE